MLISERRLTQQAALARGNGAAMRAGAWMSKERTNAVSGFRGKNVLELASLFGHFMLILNPKRMHEQALGQAVTADNIFRAFSSFFSEQNHVIAVPGKVNAGTQGIVAAIEHLFVCVWLAGMLFHLHQPQFL